MKKKVIALVIDTALTNDKLEKAGAAGKIKLSIEYERDDGKTIKTSGVPVRNVRVLDSD